MIRHQAADDADDDNELMMIHVSALNNTRALLRLERTMNLLEGGKGRRVGERGWGREGGEGRGGEGRGGEGRGG